MAEVDLDVLIRKLAKAQNKTLTAAVKKRRGEIMARAAKAKDKSARDRLRQVANSTVELGIAAAKRLHNSAEIAADAYARAIRHAAEEAAKTVAKPAEKAAEKTPPGKKPPVKKAAKKQ